MLALWFGLWVFVGFIMAVMLLYVVDEAVLDLIEDHWHTP